MPEAPVKAAGFFPNHRARIEEAAVVDDLVLGLQNMGRDTQSRDTFSFDMVDVEEQATNVELDDGNSDVESLNAFIPVDDDCGSGKSSDTRIRRLLSRESFG